MKVKLNNDIIEISPNITLEKLLQQELQITQDKKGIAVAVNDNIIPKNNWNKIQLNDKDEILVIIAAQGG